MVRKEINIVKKSSVVNSKQVYPKILIFFIAVIASIILKDWALFWGVFFYYFMGRLLRFGLLENNREKASSYIFDIVFFVFVLLVLTTQLELIHDPAEDFYFHNDAAWSFYTHLTNLVLPCKWSELINNTLLNPFFFHYPLAMLIWGACGKVGILLGVDSLRLFMRFQGCVFSSLIVSMVCNLIRANKVEVSQAIKYSLLLGLCSYVFIASATFTRDVLVMFSYTYISYIYLYPNVKRRSFKLIIGIILAFGFRPENGYIALLFLAAYYYPLVKKRIGAAWILIPTVLVVAAFPIILEVIDSTDKLFSYYVDYLHAEASSSGIFMKVYDLPFPINQIILLFYVIIQPLPFLGYVIGDGMSCFNLSTIIMPFINVWTFSLPLFYLFCKNSVRRYSYLIIVLFVIFMITIMGSPDVRRSFAVFPAFYSLAIIVKENVTQETIVKKAIFPFLIIINCAFSIYLYL